MREIMVFNFDLQPSRVPSSALNLTRSLNWSSTPPTWETCSPTNNFWSEERTILRGRAVSGLTCTMSHYSVNPLSAKDAYSYHSDPVYLQGFSWQKKMPYKGFRGLMNQLWTQSKTFGQFFCAPPSKYKLGEFLKGHTPWLFWTRGRSRNVERGVLIVCRAVGGNFVVALALLKAVYRGA